jgi:hypothetical protein
MIFLFSNKNKFRNENGNKTRGASSMREVDSILYD